MKKSLYKQNKRVAAGVIVVAICGVVSICLAQSKQTENTVKLDKGAKSPPAKIADVAWIAGHWRSEKGDKISEEVWAPPIGDTMLGMFRMVKDGKIAFCEICTIAEEKGSLVLKIKHFDAELASWEEKGECQRFPLVRLGKNEAMFDGITMRKNGDGSMTGFVASKHGRGGEVKELEFVYRPFEK